MKKFGGPLTNLYDGGCGSSKSEETRQKISATKKAMYASGEIKHWAIGKKWSKERREKTANTRNSKDMRWTDKQKDKLKTIRCLKKNKSQTRYWKITSPDGEKFIVYGLGEFCRNHDLCQAHMFEVANHRRKHQKKWICEYHDPSKG
jgi:hypothetical protein